MDNNNKNDNLDPKNQAPKDPNNKKGSFSFYWLYAILAVVLLALSFRGFDGSIAEIDNVKLRNMILQGDISEIVIMKHKEIANIYINPANINNDTAYKKAFELDKKGPHFYISISDAASFRNELNASEEALFQKDTVGMTDEQKLAARDNFKHIVVKSDNSKPWGFDMLFWILPMLLILGLFFMMRGVGGKGGNQLFSIGKSKAQLYDNNTQVSINFKDVAEIGRAHV